MGLWRWLIDGKRLGRLAENVIGGVVLALLFFLVSDVCFSVPRLDGKWKIRSHVERGKYAGMDIDFIGLLQQSGLEVHGSAEKLDEVSGTARTVYPIAQRPQFEANGYITKRYLGKDTIVLHVVEKGPLMDIRTIEAMKIVSTDRLEGAFETTRGEHSGQVAWTRNDVVNLP